MLIVYILLFSAYGVFAITTFVSSVKDALTAKFIFEDKLGISARKLEGGAVDWHEIVAKILDPFSKTSFPKTLGASSRTMEITGLFLSKPFIL